MTACLHCGAKTRPGYLYCSKICHEADMAPGLSPAARKIAATFKKERPHDDNFYPSHGGFFTSDTGPGVLKLDARGKPYDTGGQQHQYHGPGYHFKCIHQDRKSRDREGHVIWDWCRDCGNKCTENVPHDPTFDYFIVDGTFVTKERWERESTKEDGFCSEKQWQ